MAVVCLSAVWFPFVVLVGIATRACLKIVTTTIAASAPWEQPSCSIVCCAAVAPVDGAVAVQAAVTVGGVSEVAVPVGASDPFRVNLTTKLTGSTPYIYSKRISNITNTIHDENV